MWVAVVSTLAAAAGEMLSLASQHKGGGGGHGHGHGGAAAHGHVLHGPQQQGGVPHADTTRGHEEGAPRHGGSSSSGSDGGSSRSSGSSSLNSSGAAAAATAVLDQVQAQARLLPHAPALALLLAQHAAYVPGGGRGAEPSQGGAGGAVDDSVAAILLQVRGRAGAGGSVVMSNIMSASGLRDVGGVGAGGPAEQEGAQRFRA